jgi:hypothetical protein
MKKDVTQRRGKRGRIGNKVEEYEERCNTKTRIYIRRGKKRNRK